MASKTLLSWAIITSALIVAQGAAQTPEAFTKGLFAGQSITVTLGQGELAPSLQAKGYAPGDRIRITHSGHGRIKIERLAPGKPLRLATATMDHLSPGQISERLAALGLQAESPITSLSKNENLTATVTAEGSDRSALLGRRGFHANDRVTVSHVGDRFKIDRLAPGKPVSLTVSLGAYLDARAMQEMAGVLGLGHAGAPPQPNPTPVTGDTPNAAQAQAEIAQAQAEVQQSILEANGGRVVTSADAGQLKALLPEALPNLQRTNASAERLQMMGADMAMANGRYEKQGDSDTRIKIEIMDLGNLTGFMRDGMVGWLGQSFNNETEHGYVKTTEHQGYKGIEELDRARHFATLQLFVADRFLFSVEGEHVGMEAVKEAADRIDLKKLAALGTASSGAAVSPPAETGAGSSDAVSENASDFDPRIRPLGPAHVGDPVDPSTLKACLPSRAAGLPRTDLKSYEQAMSGVTVVMAASQYKGTAAGGLGITIMDTAAMSPQLRVGVAPWSTMDINRETDTGYMKTTTLGKHRAYEIVDRNTQENSVTIFLANRFYIDASTVGLPIEKARQALNQVDLKNLEALAAR